MVNRTLYAIVALGEIIMMLQKKIRASIGHIFSCGSNKILEKTQLHAQIIGVNIRLCPSLLSAASRW
jgi:hypothetical protein